MKMQSSIPTNTELENQIKSDAMQPSTNEISTRVEDQIKSDLEHTTKQYSATQIQIWRGLCSWKFKEIVLGKLLARYQRWDRGLSIVLAVASSTSIAAWTIWAAYPMVWSGIIVVSQVINAVRPFLPYNKYVKELSTRNSQAKMLSQEFKELWLQSSLGSITEVSSAKRYTELEKKIPNLISFSDEILFGNLRKLESEGNNDLVAFIESEYGFSEVPQKYTLF